MLAYFRSSTMKYCQILIQLLSLTIPFHFPFALLSFKISASVCSLQSLVHGSAVFCLICASAYILHTEHTVRPVFQCYSLKYEVTKCVRFIGDVSAVSVKQLEHSGWPPGVGRGGGGGGRGACFLVPNKHFLVT